MRPAFRLLWPCGTTRLSFCQAEHPSLCLFGQQRHLSARNLNRPLQAPPQKQALDKNISIKNGCRSFGSSPIWLIDTKAPPSASSNEPIKNTETVAPLDPIFMMPPPPDYSTKASPVGTEAERSSEADVEKEKEPRPLSENPIIPEKPTVHFDEPQDKLNTPIPPSPSIDNTYSKIRSTFNNVRTRVRKEDLPSHALKLRSDLTKRFSRSMDHMMRNLNVASQRLNNYTGTDYSGINALRSEIIGQEDVVRISLTVVSSSKAAHDAAFAAQVASQKEVVQLLERKHSWSAPDLERYMQLIRNEHVNDTTVQNAKAALAAAERKLEDDRARLEKIERKQYHEEQVWSDTIRRNSTWVTFGLMGFNIILLLLSLLILEPWRRRRMVREIRAALNEKMDLPAAFAAVAASASASAASSLAPAIEPASVTTNETGQTVVETGVTMDAIRTPTSESEPPPTSSIGAISDDLIIVDTSGPETPLLDIERALAPAASPVTIDKLFTSERTEDTDAPSSILAEPISATADAATQTPSHPVPTRNHLPPFKLWSESWSSTWVLYRTYWADLFSDRHIALRKVDLTATALEGACAGAAAMGLLFVLLRPR